MHAGMDGAQLLSQRLSRWRSVFGIAVLAASLLAGTKVSIAQGLPTATRAGDLQIGGGVTFGRSAYNFTPLHLIGESFYTTFDIRNHWGAEFDFRNVKPTEDGTVYERTYEVGPHIFLSRGAWTPYAKALIGRGVYNYSQGRANVAYTIYTFGGGIDLAVRRSMNLRVDYERQNWAGFPLGTLRPDLITVGVAYHFHE